MKSRDSSSQEFASLEALSRELNFREEDSIRSQIRKLFADLQISDAAEAVSKRKIDRLRSFLS